MAAPIDPNQLIATCSQAALTALLRELDRREVLMLVGATIDQARQRLLASVPAEDAAVLAEAAQRTLPVDLGGVAKAMERLSALNRGLRD